VFLLGVLIGLSTGFFGLLYLFRKYVRERMVIFQQKELLLHNQQEFQRLINRVYHKDLLPEICRIEGLLLLNLEAVNRSMNFLNLLKRPHHHHYSQFAIAETLESKDMIEKALSETRILKQRIIEILKAYEIYQ